MVIITLLWVIALAVLLLFGELLRPADTWWRWVCAAGIVLGLIGIGYFARSPFRR